MSEKRYRQLGIKDRECIEDGLNAKMSCSEIARTLGVCAASVSREVRRNRRDDGYRALTAKSWGNGNVCSHRRGCAVKGLCVTCAHPKKPLCSVCTSVKCTSKCSSYTEEICPSITSWPHTCNGCGSYAGCRKHRYRYAARDAQGLHQSRQREAREGIDCTEADIAHTSAIIKAGLDMNQGLAHIYAAHADEMAFSLRSCYRHIKDGSIDITLMDLPRQVRYKRRAKNEKARETMPADVIKGRSYKDFCALCEEVRFAVVEMDCIVGPKGSLEAVLTLHFKALHFQIGIKLDRKDTKHVTGALDALYALLGHKDFTRLFGTILCDRGSEFYDAAGMEYINGKKRCSIYYCDPSRSDQKGSCEKNHVELRKIIPKGTSLKDITQWELADVFSHVNSCRRASLHGKAPIEVASAVIPEEFFDALGYRLIDADEVMLTPKLLNTREVPRG
jgi:IS30 family transposase